MLICLTWASQISGNLYCRLGWFFSESQFSQFSSVSYTRTDNYLIFTLSILDCSCSFWMILCAVMALPFGKIFCSYGNFDRNWWLDDFVFPRYGYTPAEQASLESRRELRRRLKCRSFRWFLETVMPEMFVPWENATFQGQMVALVGRNCLTVDPNTGFVSQAPHVFCWTHYTPCGCTANG